MNNLTRTLMIIAVAGGVLFGGTMASQAADSFATTKENGTRQVGNQVPSDLYWEPVIGPDEEIPIPGEDDPKPEIDYCQATGKITGTILRKNGQTYLRMDHNTDGQYKVFQVLGGTTDFFHPLQSAIITEAWLRNLTVRVWAIGPAAGGQCAPPNGNGRIAGGVVQLIEVLQAPTE